MLMHDLLLYASKNSFPSYPFFFFTELPVKLHDPFRPVTDMEETSVDVFIIGKKEVDDFLLFYRIRRELHHVKEVNALAALSLPELEFRTDPGGRRIHIPAKDQRVIPVCTSVIIIPLCGVQLNLAGLQPFVIIILRHGNVDVVIPGYKTLMANGPQGSPVIYKILDIMLAADLIDLQQL